jgi:hypothetical protein
MTAKIESVAYPGCAAKCIPAAIVMVSSRRINGRSTMS